jgi:hypothetical protein
MIERVFCLLLWVTVPAAATVSAHAWQASGGWKAHDMERPRPPVVQPGDLSLPVHPPTDALVLFAGTDLDEWRSPNGGSPMWKVKNGYMETGENLGSILTRKAFGDIQLHVEWMIPTPVRGEGQARGNSGVFLMGLYEIQVLDGHENDTYADGLPGAVYGQHPPLFNASLPPGEWQTYDIVFRRPRFSVNGELLQPARVTVVHNGVLVQDAVEIRGPTRWLQHLPYRHHPDRLPLLLQEHGAPVRFRNIWVRELPEYSPSGPAVPYSTSRTILLPGEIEPLAGRYRTRQGHVYTVRVHEGRLQANFAGPAWIDLVPSSRDHFTLRHAAAEVFFDLEVSGAARAFRFHIGGEVRLAERITEP